MINKIIKNDFLKNNIIFFVGTISIAFFNYLYYPVLSRLLSVEYYGEVQALVSLYIQTGILLTVFGYITINILNNHPKEDEKVIIITELERIALLLNIAFFLVIVIFGKQVQDTLQFDSVLPIFALGPLLLVTVPFTFRNYYLQGEKKLKEVSIAGLLYSIGKLALTTFFIFWGMKSLGAMFGYIIAQLLALLYVFIKTKTALPLYRMKIPILLRGPKFKEDKVIIKRQLFFGIFVLMSLLSITLLYTFDTVIVRGFFTSFDSGLFSGISTIARIIFFGTASVAGVLLASVKISSNKSLNLELLKKSFVIIIFLGMSGVIIFSTFPVFIIRILLGTKYMGVAYLLPTMSVAMLLASITNLIITYQIALRRITSAIPATIGILLLFLLSSINHGNLWSIAINFLISNAIALIIALLIIVIEEKYEKNIIRNTSL